MGRGRDVGRRERGRGNIAIETFDCYHLQGWASPVRLHSARVRGQGSGSLTARQNRALLSSGSQLEFTPRGIHFHVTHAGFSVAVCRDGRVYAWGDSAHGCLGLGHVQASQCASKEPLTRGRLVKNCS